MARPVGEKLVGDKGSGRQVTAVAVATLAALLAVAAVAVSTRPVKAAAVAGPAASSAPARPVPSLPEVTPATPWDQVREALRLNAVAIVDGDEQAWLATVDPGRPELRSRYSAIFRELRALGLTSFDYRPGIPVKSKADPSILTFPIQTFYCFGPDTCRGDSDVPEMDQKLTMKPVGGRYVITASAVRSQHGVPGPPPWLDGRLTLVEGDRVVLAAEPGEAKYLSTVLPKAERAAVLNDKFAKTLNATQTRYRVYLAGEKQWRRWYGGVDDNWVIGAAWPIAKYGVDVIIRIGELHNHPDELQRTLQHELGHVITMTGANEYITDDKTWLAEGVAEYISWSPRPATSSLRRASARIVLHSGRRATTMIPVLPGRNASLRAGDGFYGLSHFAVDCMAHKYGQAAMFKFVREVLSFDESYNDASRYAYGIPFSKVDKACTAWIRQQV